MNRAKRKRLYKMEQQDAEGISRKKWDHTISVESFVVLKLAIIILIPIMYFVYSPLLVLCMLAYVGLFFLSIMAERRLNTSVIKSNHIKIPKMDSAIALIVVVIALFGVCMGGSGKIKKADFANMPNFSSSQIDFGGARWNNWWNDFVSSLKNFGSLLTGERSMFGDGKKDFGMMKPPENFVADMGDLPDGMPSFGGGKPSRPNFDFDIGDLPVEYMFSSIISTVNTVLIFSVSGFGLISLLVLSRKCKKFDTMMNEVIVTENIVLSDEEIDRILSFGEIVNEDFLEENENSLNQDEILNETKSEEILKEEILNKTDYDENEIQVESDISIKEGNSPQTEAGEDISILNENFDIDKIYEDKISNKK